MSLKSTALERRRLSGANKAHNGRHVLLELHSPHHSVNSAVAVYNVQCVMYSLQWILSEVWCILCSAVYSVQCTSVHTVVSVVHIMEVVCTMRHWKIKIWIMSRIWKIIVYIVAYLKISFTIYIYSYYLSKHCFV